MHRLLAVALLIACREKAPDGAPCGVVATRQLTLAQADLGSAAVDPATRQLVQKQLPAIRDALDQACREGGWSASVRDCMVQASDHAAFQACEQRLTDDQRRALDRTRIIQPTSSETEQREADRGARPEAE